MKIKRVEHIAIAVKDMAGTGKMLTDVFGLQQAYDEHLPKANVKLSMFPVGESALELLEGTSAEAGCAKWIADHGEGLYHICLEVEDIDGALDELKAKGVALLNDHPIIGHGGSRIAFINPSATGNILFELAELPASGH
jgi:methylmalonyl-CoA/ethylmalonyl-CoA epimerase